MVGLTERAPNYEYWPTIGKSSNNICTTSNIIYTGEISYLVDMASGIKDRDIEEIIKTLDRLAINPDELEQWTMSVETTAKDIRKDNDRLIVFEYDADQKRMHFSLKDAESRDSLLKSVEAYLPVVPESLQGFFSVFKYNLKNVKFDSS